MSNMQSAEFRFYAGLNFFLKEDRHFRNFRHYFSGRPAIKDTIESLGVPHPEIDLVLVNGEPVPATGDELFSWGPKISWVSITVGAGETMTAEVPK